MITEFPGGLTRCGQFLASPTLSRRLSLSFPVMMASSGNNVNLSVHLSWPWVYFFEMPCRRYERFQGISIPRSRDSRRQDTPSQ